VKRFDIRIDLAAWDRGFKAAAEGRPIPLWELASRPYHDGYRAGLNASLAAEYPRFSQEPTRLQ
jgi:hypothetical protein